LTGGFFANSEGEKGGSSEVRWEDIGRRRVVDHIFTIDGQWRGNFNVEKSRTIPSRGGGGKERSEMKKFGKIGIPSVRKIRF